MSLRNVTFNGKDLQNGTIITTGYNDHNTPDAEQDIRRFGGRDGRRILDQSYSGKEIEITGWILATSRSNADSEFETLKEKVMQPSEAELSTDFNGRTYIHKCRAVRVEETQYYALARQWRIILRTTTEPFALENSTTTDTLTNQTNNPFTTTVDYAGTAPPAPKITLTFDSVSNTNSVTFRNKTTNTECKVTPSNGFASGDNVSWDRDTLEVKVNGTRVLYNGVIPQFDTGSNDLEFSFDSDSQQVDFKSEYTARYY